MAVSELKSTLFFLLGNFLLCAIIASTDVASASPAVKATTTAPTASLMIQRSKKTYPKPHAILNTRMMRLSSSKSGIPHPAMQSTVTKAVGPNKAMKYGRKVSMAGMKGPFYHSTSHRSLRHKRYLSSGSGQQSSSSPTRQELIDLLQLLNQKQNDLDPLPRYTADDRTTNQEHEMDSIDLQSEVLSQALRNSLPAELFEQSEPSFAEQETPGAPFDPEEEGNELAEYYARRLEPSAGSQKQVPTRFRLPTSMWGRVDSGDEEETRAEPDTSPDQTLDRLVQLYEAVLRSNRD